MRKDKNEALKLRLSGKSYKEISRILFIPKSTLSGWLANVTLSEQARERIQKRVYSGSLRGLIKRNKSQTHQAIQRMRTTRAQGKKEIGILTQEELKLIGIALYWAEGYKRLLVRNGKEVTYHPVALTNSDPNLVMIFLRFLREVCLIKDEKIMADIRIYEHMNEENLLKFWRDITGLPEENFGKVYYGVSKSSMGKRPFNRLPCGTIQIRVSSTNLFHKIIGWIEGLASQGLIPSP